MKNGIHTEKYKDGRKYSGGWKDGKKHGSGTLVSANGDRYIGEFKNGKKHGEGRYEYTNGSKFVGEFKDGKKHGKATVTGPNGEIKEQEFHNGREVVSKKSELARKIAAHEDKTVELKQTFSLETNKEDPLYGKKNKKLINGKVESVMAFLNAEGGTLIIGVHDQGEILGVDDEIVLFYKDEDKFLRAVKDCMRDEIGRATLASYVNFTIETESNKKLLVITCQKSTEPVYSADGSFLKVRIGSSNESLKARDCVQYVNEHFSPKEKD
jgi:hypothetical protein